MCYLCDKIYKKNEKFHLEEHCEDAYFLRDILDENRLSSDCVLYYYDPYEGEKSLFFVKYCPECGKQVSFDYEYKGTLLNKKYKIIKEG
jgi:hypothetical protein